MTDEPRDDDALLAALAADCAVDDAVDVVDFGMIERAIEASEAPVPSAASGPSGRSVIAMAAVLSMAAAVLLWFAWPSAHSALVERGTWEGDRVAAGEGDELPLAVWLVAKDETCVEVDGSTLCATAGTEVRFGRDRDGRPRAEVRRGSVDAPAGDWVVVQVSSSQPAPRSEPEPEPQPEPEPKQEPEPEPRPQPKAEPLVPPPPVGKRPIAPAEDPATMLKRARALRGQGDPKAGGEAYAALIRQHPRSPEANVARVALGQLRLDAGRSRAALKLFDAYLQRGGSLSEEALWGKIRALKRLGKNRQLSQAVQELERRYPRSVYRGRAQELLQR